MRLVAPFLCVFLVCGCGAAEEEVILAGQSYRGVRLRTPAAEAFVTTHPYPRIVSFVRAGGAEVIHAAPLHYSAIRSWFMEPKQTGQSVQPAKQPARVMRRAADSVLLEGDVCPDTGLQVVMDVSLRSDIPRLTVKHGIRNVSGEERTYAAWGIVSFESKGRVLIPTAFPGRPGRSLTYFWRTAPDEANIAYGNNALLMDTDHESPYGCVKIGVATPQGFSALLRDEGSYVVRSPYVDGSYPEGGGNVTSFISTNEKHLWTELENVGPLTKVVDGETLWLEQTLTYLDVRVPRDADADRALEALVKSGALE